jgi:hypothetical protein
MKLVVTRSTPARLLEPLATNPRHRLRGWLQAGVRPAPRPFSALRSSTVMRQVYGLKPGCVHRVRNVRLGSASDVAAGLPDVRSAPKNGHRATTSACPFRAKTRPAISIHFECITLGGSTERLETRTRPRLAKCRFRVAPCSVRSHRPARNE